jgi:hypothetical protein
MEPNITLSEESTKEIIEALKEFTLRVTKGKATSEAEIAVLPKVAKLLLSFNHH